MASVSAWRIALANIVVGMSGGVDSAVAAYKLLQAGHQVTGLFMKNWEEDDADQYCAATEDLKDANQVCQQLGIELRTINFSYEYWQRVFQIFLTEYANGRTPNPDVLCNKEIKFKEFLQWAVHLGADKIATGHYAKCSRAVSGEKFYQLNKSPDNNKDQSYFLHTLDQNALRYAYFPLGDMQKSEVRTLAQQLGFAVHDKKDSTGICFIGERKFNDFLGRFLPAKPGKIQTIDGEILGEHRGAFYYTIGQRRGLDISGSGPAWYVAEKDIQQNIVYVVQGRDHPALFTQVVIAESVHWIAAPPDIPYQCTSKIRYQQPDQVCEIVALAGDVARIRFAEPQWAVTPGQSIVFYQHDNCLGGGIIRQASN